MGTEPARVTTPLFVSISIRYAESVRLDFRAEATALAVAWFWLIAGLGACAIANEAPRARRPNAVEIRFRPSNMALSFSRQWPTHAFKKDGERDAPSGSGDG